MKPTVFRADHRRLINSALKFAISIAHCEDVQENGERLGFSHPCPDSR